MAATMLALPALGDTQTTITFTYPLLPSVNVPDNDGILNVASHTFQEGGIQAESFWVKNNELTWSQGHFHVHFPNQFEASHGGRIIAGLGPDRQGMVLRREDGGPFDLTSLDYRLIQPGDASILIGTSFDPALPATQQLTAFPVVADPNFQTLFPAGFTAVTELFIVWDLTETASDAGYIDNIVLTIPSGTCSPSQPGGVVVSHASLTDPTTEGWTAEGPGTGVTTGPIAGDLGYDSFYVDDDSTSVTNGWRSYVHSLTPDQMCWARTSGFTLRSRVRVANTADFTDGSVTMSFFDSLKLYELRLGSTGSNDPIASVSGSSITLTGLGAGYHLYEMVYDPATKTVDLKVDGVERLSNRPGIPIQVRPPNITFGSPSTGANGVGEGRYALVEFERPPACSNGVDDDGDTLADFPADSGCAAANDTAETGVCGNATDDDGDGLVDFPTDPGCADLDDGSENAVGLVCDDGADNDGDFAIDFPADAGCVDSTDPSETTACADAADNDLDGLVDLADAGCADADDDSEKSPALVCDDGLDNDGDTFADFPADLGCTAVTDDSETGICGNGLDDDADGLADLADPGCTDADDDSEKSPALICDDGLDNDGDLAIDFPSDAGCASPLDDSETGICGNGLDDDADGLADLVDPGCTDADDDSEKSPTLICDDGLDNDGDLAIDFPTDPGCAALTSDNESPQCNDGADNDGDTLVDLADPGCASASDDLEELALPACSDGLDNDGDGLVDYPADPGCLNATSTLENPRCDDDLDNDGDGGIDWDGGAGMGTPDPQCNVAFRNLETPNASNCGLGTELVIAFPLLAALRRRTRRS